MQSFTYIPIPMYKENFQLLKRNIKSIIGFEILFSLITAGICTPILLALFNWSIKLSGLGYIANSNVMSYLLHPTTILLIIVIIFMMALISLLNILAVIQAIHASHKDEDIRVAQMFAGGFVEARRVFSKKNWFMVLYTVLIIPLTGFVAVAGYAGSIEIPEFITDFIKNNTILSIGATILAVYIVVLALKWAICYHSFVFESDDFKTACRESARLTKGHHVHIFFDVILWELTLGVLLYVISAIVSAVAVLIIKMVAGADAYSLSVNAVYLIGITMSTLYTMFSVPLVFVHLSDLYYTFKEEKGEKIPDFEPPKDIGFKKTWARTAAWGVIGVIVVVNVAGFYMMEEGSYSLQTDITTVPEVSAHRGDSASAPENSIPAFEKAIEDGADWIELDVHQTKDGVVVVTHDSDLNRIAGVDKQIYDLTYDELEQYDVGSWFSSDYSYLRVATFDEVCRLCKGKIKMNIELKPTGNEENFEANVIKVLQDNNISPDSCVIDSLQLPAIQAAKKIDPEYRTLYIMTVALGDFTKIDGVDDYSLESSFITEDTVREVHAAGSRLFAWTVNNEENVDEMIMDQVDNIITDDPVATKNMIEENKSASDIVSFVSFFFPAQAA